MNTDTNVAKSKPIDRKRVFATGYSSGGFFANMTEAFGGVLARSELLPQAVVEEWQLYQRRALEEQAFFGASNYYTYLARRPCTGRGALSAID